MTTQVSSIPEPSTVSSAAQQRTAFLAHLLDLAKQSTTAPDWLQNLRHQAIALVHEQSFPTTRDEEWRFTDLSDLVSLRLETVSDRHSAVNIHSVSQFALSDTESIRLVFVNGIYAAELSTVESLPAGAIVGTLSGLPEQAQAIVQRHLGQLPGTQELFTALNTAGLRDGAIVLIPKNQVVHVPIHLLFISTRRSTTTLIQPRCLVVAETNSAVTLIEEHVAVGADNYLTNSVTELWIESNAQVNHTRIQRDAVSAFHIGKTAVSQARDSRYTCHAINVGAQLSRHHLEIYQTGEQTETTLNGLTLIHGDQVADTHSAIALSQPYGTTRQLHKCIIDDRAHAIFNGKVFVPKAAQSTDAGQLNRNLLLSSQARVDTKPQLEIVADNVKCTHGATVGQLDTDEVFYLQSRGIDAASARRLLVYAFAYEILDQIPVDSLKQQLIQLVSNGY